MRHRLFKLLVAISAILCFATALLWIRGYFARDGVWYCTDTMRYSLHSYCGQIWFWRLSTAPGRETWSVWTTPAKIHPGFTWDSTPDSWYDQFRRNPKAAGLPGILINAPAVGATDKRLLGFRYVQTNSWLPMAQLQAGYPTERSMAIYVPDWALLVLFGALPVIGLTRIVRTRGRRRHGLCVTCGYDLRASHDLCPECGTAIPAHSRASARA